MYTNTHTHTIVSKRHKFHRQRQSELTFDKGNAVFVVEKVNLFHVEPFFLIQILFVLENSLVEKLLKLLVAIIDAKLLKAVGLEIFETGDVCEGSEGSGRNQS